ncbi:MAG: N-acetyltransferase [Roseobacter sp.]|jgi:ribosomal-protein-alanine N-acetyltransferase
MTPERMAEIHKAAFAPHRGWTDNEFRSLCASEPVECFATGDGFALVRTLANEAELLTLAVHPQGQRSGQADSIMQTWMTSTQADTAFLEVAADNHAALALYVKHGFVPFGRRKGYYSRTDGPPVDAVLMRVALTPRQSGK